MHANIISMIMDKKYIHQTPDWLLKIILVVITYLNVCVFLYVAEKRKMYYDLITKSLQLAEIALLMGLIVMLMLKFQIKINFSFVLIAVALSGDLTEFYAGSLQPLALKYLRKYGVIKSEFPNLSED